MRREALNYLACPTCKADLELGQITAQEESHILSGTLHCRVCSCAYPIIRGVPHLLPADAKNADIATGDAYAAYFAQVTSVGSWGDDTLYGLTVDEEIKDFCSKTGITDLSLLTDKTFLDAGCGIGRIDGALAQHCQAVVSFDITPAVEQAFIQWRDVPNVHIVRGDMSAIPVMRAAFDFVWCDGVLPYVSDITTSTHELLKTRAADGALYVWCYSQAVTIKERIGRFFHRTHLPLKIRFALMLIISAGMMCVASLIKRENLLGSTHSFAQGILDWSLADSVNHISEVDLLALTKDDSGTITTRSVNYMGNRGQRIELRINLR